VRRDWAKRSAHFEQEVEGQPLYLEDDVAARRLSAAGTGRHTVGRSRASSARIKMRQDKRERCQRNKVLDAAAAGTGPYAHPGLADDMGASDE